MDSEEWIEIWKQFGRIDKSMEELRESMRLTREALDTTKDIPVLPPDEPKGWFRRWCERKLR